VLCWCRRQELCTLSCRHSRFILAISQQHRLICDDELCLCVFDVPEKVLVRHMYLILFKAFRETQYHDFRVLFFVGFAVDVLQNLVRLCQRGCLLFERRPVCLA
jgi:hypothetical protein